VLVESGDEGTVKRFCKQKQIDFAKLTQKLIICFVVCLVIDYRKMNLQDLLEFVKDKFGVDKESSRRLRNIEIN